MRDADKPRKAIVDVRPEVRNRGVKSFLRQIQ